MYIVMMTKEGSTKIVTFITPRAAVHVQGVTICPVKIVFYTPGHSSDKLGI